MGKVMPQYMSTIKQYTILSICLLAPFSLDIFISGLPSMMHHFSGHNVAAVLSISLLAMCLGQPFAGPLMDHYGRKPVMIVGLVLFCLASLIIVMTHQYALFVISKFFQTLGGAFGVVGAFAISRDTSDEKALPHVIGVILAMIGVSPIVAPLIGGYLNTVWGWKASFYCLLVMGLVYLGIITCFYKESFVKQQAKPFRLLNSVMFIVKVLRVPRFFVYTLIAACAYSIIFSFLNVSPMLLIHQLAISKISYGWLIGLNAVAMIIMAKLAPHWMARRSFHWVMTLGLLCIFVGAGAMCLLANWLSNAAWLLMVPMFIVTIGTGTLRPITNSAAMHLIPKNLAGSAAGAFSLVTFAIATLASFAVLHVVHSTGQYGLWILGFFVVALIAFAWLHARSA